MCFITPILIVSCVKISSPDIIDPVESLVSANGLFIVNEGNFGWGNGSLTYFSYDSSKIYNNIFQSVNSRPLGDVPCSMIISGNNIYIVVNNSEKIEVIDRRNLKSKATITGLISPRNIAIAGENKAYITSMYSDSLRILDLNKNKVTGYINIHNTSEAIMVKGEKAFIANWIGGNEIFVVNTVDDKLVDSILVGPEPESIAEDKNGIIWVLCNGGWKRENFAELVGISPQTHDIFRRYIFPSRMNSPLNLCADSDGDTLFYLDDGIKCLDITSQELPAEPFIEKEDHLFYKTGVNPANGDIIVTDAVDYQQNGYMMIYNRKGKLATKWQAGIIPGYLCFMVETGHYIY